MPLSYESFSKLSASERILFAQYLWESVAAEQTGVPLDDATRKELDRILDAEAAGQVIYEDWDNVQ